MRRRPEPGSDWQQRRRRRSVRRGWRLGVSGTATGSTGPVAGPADPCSLLTQAEVSAVLGQAVAAGSSADDPHACDWTFKDPNDALTLVSATVTTNINASTFAKLCGPKTPIAGITVFAVSGIGDSACITESTGLGTSLAFQKGGRGYTVGVLGLGKLHDTFSNPVAEAAEKVLAAEAAARG